MWQPRGSARKGGDDVMAVMIRFSAMARTCPGWGNRNLIYTTRDLSEITSDNLTYQLLYYITTSTCATVSSHILSYAGIYGYTALHLDPVAKFAQVGKAPAAVTLQVCSMGNIVGCAHIMPEIATSCKTGDGRNEQCIVNSHIDLATCNDEYTE